MEEHMSIKILKAGIHSSIQDRGRFGFQRYGVSISGCMDQYAAAVANLLTGNSRNEALVEITLHGMQIQFLEDSLVAFSGGGALPFIHDHQLSINKAIWIPRDSVIDFRYHHTGCRLYMAVAGGWNSAIVMNSRSSFPWVGAGKLLTAGDILDGGFPSRRAVKIVEQMDTSTISMANWGYAETEIHTGGSLIRVMKGPEWELFTNISQTHWLQADYELTNASNRMGYRLSGEPLMLHEPKEMISTAVTMGTVQVTPDGSPLILMADAQTTGGYPRIAQVIDVDCSICAQKKPGDQIRFSIVTATDAEALFIEREEQLVRLEKTIQSKMGI
jgi:antagonist of KipI